MNGPRYKDYYKILGIDRSADEKSIKSAYRRLARKYHPDVNPGDRTAEERFKEISEAYEALSDPHKRAQYDSLGEQWRQYSQARPQAGQTPFGGAGSFDFDIGAGGERLGELFETLFGGRRGRAQRAAATGEDVEFGIELTLEEVFRGTSREEALTIEDLCPACGGVGNVRRGRGAFDIGAVCPDCRGHGRITRTRRVKVKVPPGTEEGRRLRVPGQGGAGTDGTRGDLYLVVRMKPHARFELRGRDIYTDADIPFTVAALGGEASVATLTGPRTLNVPAGVQSGQRIRIAGQGMPDPGGRPGDLYARVRVTVPKEPSPRERELLHQLARIRGDSVRSQ